MNFAFNEEQLLIKNQAAHFLAKECPIAQVRSVLESETHYDDNLWQKIAELGWTALTIPEDHGGLGLGYLELAVIAEELGKVLAPVPFLSSVVLATELIKQADQSIQADLLPKLAEGNMIGCVALADESNANCCIEGDEISGSLPVVVDAQIADFVLLKTAKDKLYMVNLDQPQVVINAIESIDPSQALASVSLTKAKAQCILQSNNLEKIIASVFDAAAVIASFLQIGLAGAAMQTGINYTKERYAFGRQVGSFQAIKHKFADMFVQLELAKSNSYYGAWALSSADSNLPVAASTARLSASKAVEFITKENIQVHGGMGFTWEFDCHLYYRRGHYLNLVLFNEHYWQERLLNGITTLGNLNHF